MSEDRPAARQFQQVIDDLPDTITGEANRIMAGMEVMGHAYAHALNEAFRRKLLGNDEGAEQRRAEATSKLVETIAGRYMGRTDFLAPAPPMTPAAPPEPVMGVSGCATVVALLRRP